MNAKHKSFADYYLNDPERNGRRAYKKVYPNVKDSTADNNACRLLKNAQVKAYIRKIGYKITKNIEVTNEMIMEEYRKLAYFDIRKLFNEDGTLKNIVDLDDDTASAISAIDISTIYKPGKTKDEILNEVTRKIKAIDKKGALDSLARIRGLFVEKLEVEVKKLLIDV